MTKFIAMPIWKRNLYVCWFGMFVTSIGLSQIAPILPLYIKQLGIHNETLIEQYSGFAFGITFIVSALFSPIWGIAADRYGRKLMLLRASFGMAIVIFSMAFVHNIYQLIGLRLLQGTVTGFATACTILIAAQTDKKYAGWALGTLSTATISGSLFGPTIGGYLGGKFGFQSTFFITGLLLMIAFVITSLFVTESFVISNTKKLTLQNTWHLVPDKNLTLTMFSTFFILQVALYSVEPIITIYIAQLSSNITHVALLAGLTFSASGLANIIAAPKFGRLSDKIGPHKVILVALIVAAIIFIPQAFVTNPWQLMGLRFLLGLTTAGLAPSINILIKKITPDALIGTVFGFNMSARFLGVSSGAILGGQVASHLGIHDVFFITSALLSLNAIWVYYKVYLKLNHQGYVL